MHKRRIFPVVLVGAVIFVGVAAAIAAAIVLRGRGSDLSGTWATLVAAMKESFASEQEPEAQAVDAGGEGGDAAIAVHRQRAPLSSAQLSAPLVHAPFVSACGAPDEMKVVAEVTVKMGRAAVVTVKSYPSDPTVTACVERAIRDLQWDISPKSERVTVTY
jgi:hypothetical protein